MTTKRSVASLHLLRLATMSALLVCLAVGAAQAGDAVNARIGGVAIRGYDPVAYFTDGRAVKGSSEFSFVWLGATWLFASAEHRDTFTADPIRHAPQYGGFCALAMTEGDAANVDPEAWRIIDGRLYLFNSKDNLESEFDAVSADVIERADANWPAVKAELEGN